MTWQELTAEVMVNYYLYGQKDKPNLVDENLIRDGIPNNENDSKVTLQITNLESFLR